MIYDIERKKDGTIRLCNPVTGSGIIISDSISVGLALNLAEKNIER